ncbi:MAG: ABC-2 family transporter protein [Clostridiales bacterium]|nr:ABC-2 family transporter protein [Clostridiales bacterium]
MMKILKRMHWYLKLLFLFMKLSLQSQLEYRLNFLAGASVEIACLFIKLVYLILVSRTGESIGFLTPDMIMIFIGTYIFMTGMWMLFRGINSIPSIVLRGELDVLMTKPGSLQFLQTFGSFDLAKTFPNVIAGIVLIIIGWSNTTIAASFANITGFLFFIVCGIILTYSFSLIAALLVFWITSRNAVLTLYAALWDFNNMPMAIYPKTMQLIGTFIIPIFVIFNWSGLFILGQLDMFRIIYGAVIPIIVFVLSRMMWKRGIMRYYSANG